MAPAAPASHYQRLGVRPSASTAEIRQAYRALAQRLHPDRQQRATPAEQRLAERRMREVNESWAVLRDPDRRRAYDAERGTRARPRSPARPTSTSPQVPAPVDDDDLVDVLPPMGRVAAGLFRHLPWIVLLVVLGTIFVATAYAGGGDDDPATSAVDLPRCVDVASGPTTTIVDCDGPHELEIVARVDELTECPEGTERRRLDTDGLLDCVIET